MARKNFEFKSVSIKYNWRAMQGKSYFDWRFNLAGFGVRQNHFHGDSAAAPTTLG